MRKCPYCGRTYSEYPALSRKDNHTEICPKCGVQEAIDEWSSHCEDGEVEIYTAYSEDADITFIMGDRGRRTMVLGFYYGEPNEEDTKKYYGNILAEYQ